MRQVLHDVFHHYHGGVDQHADRNREAAQAHQIRRHAEVTHQDERDECRQRQHQRHGECRADVAEKQAQQQDDQYCRLGQGDGDGADRFVDQRPTVVKNVHVNAFGQGGFQLIKLFLHALYHLLGIRTREAQHQPLHRFVTTALRHHAIAGHGADFHLGQATQPNRHCIFDGHHDGAQIIKAGDAAFGTDQQHFLAFPQPSGAIVTVVGPHRFFELCHRDTRRRHAHGLRNDFKGAHHAAQ